MAIKFLFLLMAIPSYATPSQDAVNHAASALYEYNHWDEDVNKVLQQYENKLTPKQKLYGGYVVFVINAFIHQEVRFIWKF